MILVSIPLTFSQPCEPGCSDGQVCTRLKWKFWKHECKDPIYVGENEGCFREYICKAGLVCERSVCKKPIIGVLGIDEPCEEDTECKNGLKCTIVQKNNYPPSLGNAIYNQMNPTCQPE